MLTFQEVILTLQKYWGAQGCALLQPYDMEVGAGTLHTATFLRAFGPEPWRAGTSSRRAAPRTAATATIPIACTSYHQYQVVLKPSPSVSCSCTWRSRASRH